MKPFDGGQWVGVTRIENESELQASYDASGERLMHLQSSLEDFDVFVRTLSIGAESMVMYYEPDRPLHDRYQIRHEFLPPGLGLEVVTFSRLVNAFFRWEFNSSETIVKDGTMYPIDYANASPDVALTSLHYYFPWAMSALVKWSAFCLATGRESRVIDQDTRPYFAVGDRDDLEYAGRWRSTGGWLTSTSRSTPTRSSVPRRYRSSTSSSLGYVESPEFDDLLVRTVTATFPAHEHEQFVAHYRGILAAWTRDRTAQLEAKPAG